MDILAEIEISKILASQNLALIRRWVIYCIYFLCFCITRFVCLFYLKQIRGGGGEMRAAGCCLTQSSAEAGSEGWGGWIPECPASDADAFWRWCILSRNSWRASTFRNIQGLHASRDRLATATMATRSATRRSPFALVLLLHDTNTWTAEESWSSQHHYFCILGSQVSHSFFMLEFCLEISLFFSL